MNREKLASMLDHSVLAPESGEAAVRDGAEIVVSWRIGFYCVQPYWVRLACELLRGRPARVVAVAGFPHGCERTATKASAAALAVADGADEIDMVINIAALRSRHLDVVERDIAAVVQAAASAPVKAILETAVLSDEEKVLACRIACRAGARFVKTSTGFHPAGGATIADVRLLRNAVGPTVGVKAAGGIRTLADARALIDAGADRVGTSASVAILTALGPG